MSDGGHATTVSNAGADRLTLDGRAADATVSVAADDLSDISVVATQRDDRAGEIELHLSLEGATVRLDLHPLTATGLAADLQTAVERVGGQYE